MGSSVRLLCVLAVVTNCSTYLLCPNGYFCSKDGASIECENARSWPFPNELAYKHVKFLTMLSTETINVPWSHLLLQFPMLTHMALGATKVRKIFAVYARVIFAKNSDRCQLKLKLSLRFMCMQLFYKSNH